MKHTCLSIAGFDSSGGAGIQGDLKTFSALGCYGMTVLTALPVQNTQGVSKVYQLPLQSIEDQLEAIFCDIEPLAIKIGMLFSSDIIKLVANFLRDKIASPPQSSTLPIVLDPVMIAKSGDILLQREAITILKAELMPLATVITPNLPEAYRLLDTTISIDGSEEYETIHTIMEELGHKLLALGPQALLLKGGHTHTKNSDDLLINNKGEKYWLCSSRISSKNLHGTGCTLSSAVCAFLAQGLSIVEACQQAKQYVFGTIEAAQNCSVGKGHGPVHHFYDVWPNLAKRTYLEKN